VSREHHGVRLTLRILAIHEIAIGKLLRTVADDFEDVGAASIGGHLELLVESRELVRAPNRLENGGREYRLGLPVA